MYHHLRGTVTHRKVGSIALEVGGVGYLLQICGDISQWPEIGSEVQVFTHLVVRENEMFLCGFQSTEERELFLQLIKVSGVGPTLGLTVLGQASLHRLIGDVVSSNVESLTKLKGIGKKTAERIIIELRDKLHVDAHREDVPKENKGAYPEDAMLALIALGFTPDRAKDSLEAVAMELGETEATDAWIKLALKHGR